MSRFISFTGRILDMLLSIFRLSLVFVSGRGLRCWQREAWFWIIGIALDSALSSPII